MEFRETALASVSLSYLPYAHYRRILDIVRSVLETSSSNISCPMSAISSSSYPGDSIPLTSTGPGVDKSTQCSRVAFRNQIRSISPELSQESPEESHLGSAANGEQTSGRRPKRLKRRSSSTNLSIDPDTLDHTRSSDASIQAALTALINSVAAVGPTPESRKESVQNLM